ncbi:unnamed protein product, partial [Closterium sp. NIES-53]
QFLHDCQRAWNANLSGWNEIVYCDNAEGITCDSNGMVATLGLTGVGLQGPIPASISNLRELVDLDFNTNQLYGSIPTEVFTLTKLTHLNLGSNLFSSSIPSEVGMLTNLIST